MTITREGQARRILAATALPGIVARAELRVALDVFLERLPNPRLLEEPVFVGAAIRGPRQLRIAWG